MRVRRLALFSAALSLAIFTIATAPSHGQTDRASTLEIVAGLGLPAVELTPMIDESRAPGTPEGVRRRARSLSASPDFMAADGSRYLAGRVIVKFKDGVSTASRLSALSSASYTARMSARPSDADFDVIRIDPNEDPAEVARELSKRDDVVYAQPSHRIHTEFVPNDTEYKRLQWNFPLIDLERAWDIQPQAGSSITVAVIDTGVAYTAATIRATLPGFILDGVRFPALGPVVIPYSAAPQLAPSSRFDHPRDFICPNSTTPLDFDGHGTHVSGTIGQTTNDNASTAGIAFNVKIMPIKVLASVWDVLFGCADDIGGTDDDVARGIRYAADNGAKVINLSLGAAGEAGSAPVVEDAIKYAVGKGVFIAIAAGNDFLDGNPMQVVSEIAGRVKGAVAVAAVDPLKRHASYSSAGDYVEVAAPGGDDGFGRTPPAGFIWQETFDFAFTDTFLLPPSRFTAPRFDMLRPIGYAGTSQAAPHVAALAAMLMQQGITDPAAIEAALERFATDLGDPGRDKMFGFGLVQARDTLRGLGITK